MDGIDELANHLGRFQSAPFLFVGSGVSRRYLGLETWAGLLEKMAGLTSRPYSYYQSRGGSDAPTVAAHIADAFFDIWWDEDEYRASREEHSEGLRDRESPLKVEVARHVNQALSALPKKGALADELTLLRKAVIDGVITTNYDRLLEEILDDFRVFVGQDELLFSDPQGVGEIYKIHGSSSQPDSLVLTRTDYDRFRDRNPYLAAKLLTIFVEHPIIFLGYSLNDPNVTEILDSIASVLTSDNIGQIRDRLIFVQWDPDLSTASFSQTVVASGGFTIPVVRLEVPDFLGLFATLTELPRHFPARLLRRLKEHVYNLVLENDPSGRLAVVDIDDASSLDEVEVVFGVGIKEELGLHGYVGLSREELLFDVLKDNSGLRASGVLEALPSLRGNVPIYRYLREAGVLDSSGRLSDGAEVDDRVRRRVDRGVEPFLPASSVRDRATRLVTETEGNLYRLAERDGIKTALSHYGICASDKIDFGVLRRFLVETQSEFYGSYSSAWSKLVCLYDYYVYGAGATD